ncbi:MAG: hypothetical protein EOP05_01055 [Proteobacteria bacterium]|nr:MAG: hypothetical protein EOP05_01055 [Pseudomonadota bacterium]
MRHILIFAKLFVQNGVSLIICLMLMITPIQFAFAGPHANKAQDYVKASHARAREIARNFVRNHVIQAAQIVLKRTANTAEISRLVGTSNGALKVRSKILKTTSEDIKINAEELKNQINVLTKDFSEQLTKVESARLNSLDAVAATKVASLIAMETLSAMEKSLKDLCKNGVAMSIDSPNLPNIQPFVPPLVIKAGYNSNVQGQGDGGSFQGSAMSYSDQNAEVRYALITATTHIAVFYALTGKLILTQAAMANLALSTAATGLVIVAAIVAAYAVIDHLIQMGKANEEALDIRAAVKDSVFNRATSEDVRRYSIEACQEISGPILATRKLIDEARRKGGLDPAFEVREAAVKSVFDNFLKARETFGEAAARIEKDYANVEKTKENEERFHKEVTALAEYKAMTKASEALTPDKASELIQVSIARLVLDSNGATEKAIKDLHERLKDMDTDPYYKQLAELRKTAMLADDVAKSQLLSQNQNPRDLGLLATTYKLFDELISLSVEKLFNPAAIASPTKTILLAKKAELSNSIRSLNEQNLSAAGVQELEKLASSANALIEAMP